MDVAFITLFQTTFTFENTFVTPCFISNDAVRQKFACQIKMESSSEQWHDIFALTLNHQKSTGILCINQLFSPMSLVDDMLLRIVQLLTRKYKTTC